MVFSIDKEYKKYLRNPKAYTRSKGGKLIKKDEKNKIYVMDNHRWTFYCWEKQLGDYQENILLIHIDEHPDACKEDKYKNELGKINNDKDLKKFTETYVHCDDFIYYFELRHKKNLKIISLINEHEAHEAPDEFHIEQEEFFNSLSQSQTKYMKYFLILDIDLDYFVGHGLARSAYNPWDEEEIDSFFKKLSATIKRPNITTIATSPEYLGQEADKTLIKRADDLQEKVESSLKKYFYNNAMG